MTYDDIVLVTESDKEFFDISDTSDDSENDVNFNVLSIFSLYFKINKIFAIAYQVSC